MEVQLKTPQDYGLSHGSFRPHQRETIEWLFGMDDGIVLLEAPTGSGKTMIARALAVDGTVTALCRTKNLQDVNYGRGYDFDVLKGKPNYDCIHPSAHNKRASQCLYGDEMRKCEHYAECPYIVQREIVRMSNVRSLNYPYWFTARWTREPEFLPRYLVLDEAHLLSEAVLSYVGCGVSKEDRKTWDLPDFPYVRAQVTRMTSDGNALPVTEQILDWLNASVQRLSHLVELTGDQHLKLRGERLLRKLRASYAAMSREPSDWYIVASPVPFKINKSDRKLLPPQLKIRPVSARHHFSKYFLFPGVLTLCMSATIGNFPSFASELGVSRYESASIPNQWPVDVRPVLDLPAPQMSGKDRSPAKYEKQADVIAAQLRDCPREWCGVIHVSSKWQARELAKRLARRGFQDRVWTPREPRRGEVYGTEQHLRDWETIKRKRNGAHGGQLAVTWSMWEGVDLTEERICIVAKCPFPNLADDYERRRQRHDGKMFLQRAAWNMEQGLGRTRRGRPQDYDLNGDRAGLVAIADRNWRRAQKYVSASMRESIVEVQ